MILPVRTSKAHQFQQKRTEPGGKAQQEEEKKYKVLA
jgi:hypothetical protein